MNFPDRMRNRWVLAAASPAIIGIATILIATQQWGIGLSPDSVTYVSTAESLLSGEGYVIRATSAPLTRFPPLYPTGIAALSRLLGIHPIPAARFLNAALFGVNIFLVGALVWAGTSSVSLVFIASVFTLSSADMLQIHWMAWSEPLFITFVLCTFLLLRGSLVQERPPFAAAALSGLAGLTRYLGVVMSGVGALSLVFFGSGGITDRARKALLYLLVSLLPAALWMARNLTLTGSPADRQLTFYASAVQRLLPGLDVVLGWFMPERFVKALPTPLHAAAVLLALAALVGLVTLAVVGGHNSPKTSSSRTPDLALPLALFAIGYLLLFGLLVLVAEPQSNLNNRYLSPVYPAVVILTMMAIHRHGFRFKGKGISRLSLVVLLVVVLASYVGRAALHVARMYREGGQYGGKIWKSSPTIAQVKRLPIGTTIYSNAYDAIYVLTGLSAQPIPAKLQIGSRQPNPSYPSRIRYVAEVLRAKEGVLVYFDPDLISFRWYLPTRKELDEELGLIPIYAGPDGSILMLKDGRLW